MLATLAAKPFSDPEVAVRDQVGRLPGPGGRRATARSGSGRATSTTPRPTSRGSCATELDRRPAGDRRRRGRGPRRGRPPGLQPAPGAPRRAKGSPGLVFQAFDLLYLDGRSLLDVALEDRKRLLKSVLRPHPRVRFAAHVEADGETFHRGRGGPGPRGHRRQAPPLALRAGPPVDGLAEDQDPSGAGAGRRRLDAGDGQRQGPRRAGRRRLRGRRAAVRRQGRLRVHRRDPQGAPRAARAADPGRSRVRPAAAQGLSWPLGRRPRRRHLGPARARHPRGARRLVARRAWSASPRSRASRKGATR